MALNIHLEPKDVWAFFRKNLKRCEEELVEVASNTDTNTSVFLTEENSRPYMYVYRDDKKIYQEECLSSYGTERVFREAYTKYLLPIHVVVDDTKCEDQDNETAEYTAVDPCKDLEDMSNEEFLEACNERETVIQDAVKELLLILTEDEIAVMEFDPANDDSSAAVVDHIVEYLAITCGYKIRRPMVVFDDDEGIEARTEYPYEEFDFRDDELSQ